MNRMYQLRPLLVAVVLLGGTIVPLHHFTPALLDRPAGAASDSLAAAPSHRLTAAALDRFTALPLDGLAAQAAEPASRPPAEITLRRSDVVFMYDNPARYESYGCTVLGWAGRADAAHIEKAHALGVRLFTTSIGFRTEGRGVMDFTAEFLDAACKDLAGKPIVVPWLWDHRYKGHPYYWWCTNSPQFRRYLDDRLRRVMAARPDGLHIDDYTGTAGCVTWLGGCFCPHCMAAFRQYLAGNLPKQSLAELGIADVEKFDYGKFLTARGETAEKYVSRRGSLPLAREFYDFQLRAVTQFVAEYARRAAELRGKPIAFSVNSHLTDPSQLAIAPYVTYFCCEVDHQASRGRLPGHPIYVYKLADGLARPVAATASGQDWAFINQHNKSGLVRLWVALSYAFGHNFMAPHRQWCYTKEKGTHWYDGPTEQYAWLYQFIRRHAALLDEYEAVAPLAVVYDNAARRQNRANIEPICIALAEQNVPFTVVVSGDDWLKGFRLEPQRLAGFRAVGVPQDHPALNKADAPEWLNTLRENNRLLVWPDQTALEKLVGRPVSVDGSDRVLVVPRIVPGNPKAPAVVHLVNRAYQLQDDSMEKQKHFTVRLRMDLFPGRQFRQAVLHAPQTDPLRLPVSSDNAAVVFKTPALELWAIVELRE